MDEERRWFLDLFRGLAVVEEQALYGDRRRQRALAAVAVVVRGYLGEEIAEEEDEEEPGIGLTVPEEPAPPREPSGAGMEGYQ